MTSETAKAMPVPHKSYAHQAAKILRLAAIAAGLLICGLDASAAAPAWSAPERLSAYEIAIASGDPAGAAAFLKDGEARELAEADAQKCAALLGKAEALKDLKDLLAMPWEDSQVNKLNQSLMIRIDIDRPLSKMGVGPGPEKLLVWLAKFQPSYPAGKTAVVKKAIRQWEVVFGTMTDTRSFGWDQADMRSGQAVTVTKAAWQAMVIRERNAVIEKMIKADPKFLIYNDERLAALKNDMAVDVAVRTVINSGALTPAQVSRLSGKTFTEQAYLLGNMFDNSNVAVSPELKAKINSARGTLPQEVLQTQHRELLGGMLNTAVAKELTGTKAGDKALAAFPGGLRITVAPLSEGYSRYDAATGSIVLDSETIQQYMRLKGYTSASLMTNPAQVAEIAKYMSPAVVYESAHKMQADWAARRGVYKPHVQEDEIEAMSLEGLYTTEKIRKDVAFKGIFDSSRDYSPYASKRVAIATKYEKSGSKAFATTVSQLYFPGLPSLVAASSQVLCAVTEELDRRAALPAAEKASLASNGLNLEEALEMSPEELAGSAGEIQTPVLVKIQGDLSNLGAYKIRYIASEMEGSRALKSLKAGAPKTGASEAI
ncbi:MAG: hypothetical protein Q7R35_16380 [Elusimicrobiota bacterium]|nr:hypothetical protein [Elusimicrobiota bacterium]